MNGNINSSIRFKIVESGRHFLIYGIGSVLQGFVGFLLLPLVTRFLEPAAYGIYTLIVMVGAILGAFFYLGAQSSITRFFYDKEGLNDKKREVTNTSFIMIIGSFLLVGIGIIFSSALSKIIFDDNVHSNLIIIVSITSSLSIINTYLVTLLRLLKKSSLFITVNVINLLVNLLVTLILLNAGILSNPILSIFVGQISGLSISIILSLRTSISYITLSFLNLDNILKHLKFGLPVVIIALVFYLFDWSDRYAIERFSTMYNVGIYSFAVKIGGVITLLFLAPFSMFFGVLRMEYAKSETINGFYSLMISYFSLVGLFLVIILSAGSKILMSFLAGSHSFMSSSFIIPWILFGIFVFGFSGLFDYGIYLSKKTYHYIWIYGIGLIVNFFMNFLILNRFGFEFAAINKLFSSVIIVLLFYFVSNKHFKFQLERRLYILAISGSIILILISIINFYNLSFLWSFCCIFILVVFWYFKFFNKTEKEFLELTTKGIVRLLILRKNKKNQ